MITTDTTTSQDNARYAAKASAIYENLLKLDPDEAHRRELLEAGIGQQRVDTLHPKRFEAIAPGLVRHLGGDIRNAMKAPRIAQSSSVLGMMRTQALPAGVRASYFEDFASAGLTGNLRGKTALFDLYRPLTKLWALPDADARKLMVAAWNAWWLMAHREEIEPARLRPFADLLLIDVVSYMARDLLPKSEVHQIVV